MAHISDLIGTDIAAYLHQHEPEPAAVHHLRQRGRRQVHAHRRLLYDSKMIFETARGARADSRRSARRRGPRCAAGGRARGRARAGHHHRRGLRSSPPTGASSSWRHSRARAVQRNMVTAPPPGARRDPDRRAQGVLTQTAPQLPGSLLGIRKVVLASQDGPRGLLPRDFDTIVANTATSRSRSASTTSSHPCRA